MTHKKRGEGKQGCKTSVLRFIIRINVASGFMKGKNKDTGALVIWKKNPIQTSQQMLACANAPLNKLLSFYIILSSFIFLEWCLLGNPPPPCPRPLQFSNVRLNMRARLVSSQALAAIYGTDEAQFAQNWQQQMSRQLFSFCEVCTKYFFTLAPNRAKGWNIYLGPPGCTESGLRCWRNHGLFPRFNENKLINCCV